MFTNLTKWWNKYGFETCAIIAIVFILIFALFRIGKKGSWSDTVILSNENKGNPRGEKADSKGEVECRRVLEETFKKPFPKIRPSFLKNPVTSDQNANNLELDCYNDELKIAVEYNGIQHYKYVPFFHRTRDSFQNQKYRDYMKREMCQKNGVTLIEVPYTVKIPEIREYILERLNKLNLVNKK